MLGVSRLFNRALVVALLLPVVGCVTTPELPSIYTAATQSQIPIGALHGSTYSFYVTNFGIDSEAGPQELGPVLSALEQALSTRGVQRIDDIDAADFTLFVAVGYGHDAMFTDEPVYAGGERHRIEYEYQVPHYDRQGRYRGMRTERDYYYYRTPRVQTGVRTVRHDLSRATINLAMDSNALSDELRQIIVGDPTSPNPKGQGQNQVVYASHSQMQNAQLTLLDAGQCLINMLAAQFPSTSGADGEALEDPRICQIDVGPDGNQIGSSNAGK